MDLLYIQVDCYINSLLEFSLYFKPLLPVYSLDHPQSTLVPHLLEVTCEQSFRKMDGDKGVTSMCFFYKSAISGLVLQDPWYLGHHTSMQFTQGDVIATLSCTAAQISPILGCQGENKGAR